MSGDPTDRPGARLERALELFLADSESHSPDSASLLESNASLRDLLEPMLAGAVAVETTDERVLGDYRLVREIGRGGMGVVYEAWQRSLDRRVALKVLAPALTASPSAVARFRREAAAAGRLRHEGIVEVFDFGSDGGQHFFAMQLVDGEPLHLCADRFRTPDAALALIVQVTAALQHAHAAGLVHRDVKPANILVRKDGTAVLTDFGLASDESLPSMTREGAFLGTLDYASPEQVRGERADARADLFATGVVWHELLTGRHPFRAATQEATMHRILSHDPPSVRLHDRRIPVDVAAVVGRALEPRLAQRYASAAAMAADLLALQRGEPVSARLPSRRERLWRWARREPWRAAAVLLLVVGVPMATGAAGFLMAKAPAIAAGEQSIATKAREAVLASAWLDYAAGDCASGLARLGELDQLADEETAVLRTVLLVLLQRRDEAAQAIAPWTSRAALTLARSQQLPHPASKSLGEGPHDAATPMECFVGGVATYATAMRTDDEPAPFKTAMAMFHRAVLLSPAPRASLLVMLVRASARAGDQPMLAEARLALERHFGDQSFTRTVTADVIGLEDPAKGLALAQQLIAESPTRPLLHYNSGVLLAKLGRRDEAEAAYRHCVELAPDQANAWNNLGMLLRQRGANDEAVAAYRNATAARPDFAKAWNNLGVALQRAEDLDGARAALQRALAESPGYAKASYNLGNLHLATGDNPAAIAAYRQAIASEPDYMRALSNLAVAYMRSEQWQEALAPAERALALAPADPGRLENVAVIAVVTHRSELARRTASRWIELAPNAAKAWSVSTLAWLAEPGADPAAAVKAGRRARELAPNDAEATLVLARALAAAGQPEEARPLLAQLLEGSVSSRLEPRLRQELTTLRTQLAQ